MGPTIKWAMAIGGVTVCLAGGCGSNSTYEFDALDLAPPQEELREFLLGQYSIPIPVAEDQGSNVLSHRNRFQLDFELHALVRPEQVSQVADDWARHEGKIRDHVIRVCRNASVGELQEPELSTLKARLMDALAAHMGTEELRQLLITEVVSQEL
ncbi:MAG: flagellar basal body-associated FliL family protein [Planctomycetes bacterium]|nr:flagellar basal body-associated FliL family protein [Planctomycetota bacterium]